MLRRLPGCSCWGPQPGTHGRGLEGCCCFPHSCDHDYHDYFRSLISRQRGCEGHRIA